MAKRLLDVAAVVGLLRATPSRIAELTAPVPADRLHEPPSEGEWSAREVLAHLRACADVWGGCIVTMLDVDRPTIRAVNPRAWIDRTDHLAQRFGPSLRAFAAQRAELLARLEPLPPEAWERSATITGAGRPLQHTVRHYADRMATHERAHLRQIDATVAAVLSHPHR